MSFNPAIHGALHASRMAAINHHGYNVTVSNQDTTGQDTTKNEYHTTIQADAQNPTGISTDTIGCICAVSLLTLIVIITIFRNLRNF